MWTSNRIHFFGEVDLSSVLSGLLYRNERSSISGILKNEENINLSLSYLSTYLGHKSFNETQKYIWMTPIIFEDIKNKMEEYSRFIMDIFGGEKFDEDE